MEFLDLKKNRKYLEEYCRLCSFEWGESKSDIEMNRYVSEKIEKILSGDKVICVIGLILSDTLIGFISLFRYDGGERRDLTPWYATMYVKEQYRNHGYSKILHNKILQEASILGYDRVYLKTDLVNYYEKFGAVYMEDLKCGEKLYYIDCKDKI